MKRGCIDKVRVRKTNKNELRISFIIDSIDNKVDEVCQYFESYEDFQKWLKELDEKAKKVYKK